MIRWRRILCPVDLSESSRRALHVAADLARERNADLALLHVYQAPGVTSPGATIYAGDDMLKQLVELAKQSLAQWQAEAQRLGAQSVSIHTAMGVPFSEIVRFAEEEDADLIVMGTHGRTALMRVLIGSVAEKVVRHAPCPVLTVRPEKGKEVAAEITPSGEPVQH